MYCIIAQITSTASVILKRFHHDIASELQFHDSAHFTCQSSWAFLLTEPSVCNVATSFVTAADTSSECKRSNTWVPRNDGDYQMIHNQNFSIGFDSNRSDMRILYPPPHSLQSLWTDQHSTRSIPPYHRQWSLSIISTWKHTTDFLSIVLFLQ
jgi:hypothetical protein